MSWADLELARRHWPDAAKLPDAVLGELLDASTIRCRDYAPPLPVDETGTEAPPLINYQLANVYDARDIRAAGIGDIVNVDQVLVGDFTVTRRPLSNQVRALLRAPRPAVAR